VYLSFFLFPSFGVDVKKHGHLWKAGISVLLVHAASQTAQPPNHQALNPSQPKPSQPIATQAIATHRNPSQRNPTALLQKKKKANNKKPKNER
jgi:hypothetical protein